MHACDTCVAAAGDEEVSLCEGLLGVLVVVGNGGLGSGLGEMGKKEVADAS